MARSRRRSRSEGRRAAIVGALLALVASPRAARAGDAFFMQILAATPDGSHVALFQSENGVMKTCGLAKAGTQQNGYETNLVVAAKCTSPDGALLPIDKWTWPPARPPL